MQNICFNCFHYAPEGRACPYCKYDPRVDEGKNRLALKPGTILANRYLLGRVLGQGGFGITYVALDNQTKSRVAIKEYLPVEYAYREEGSLDLKLNGSMVRADFEYGKEQFIAEARTLSQFIGNEHIISIHALFEANGTAYFAMEFVEGVDLKKYKELNGGPLPVHVANRILMPIMESMEWVHSKGVVHRDIAPDNIMVRRDGKAKLIDFGAARYSTGEKSKSLDVILKHGFAPCEQYSRRGRQGPFTDVYAMAATYYYAITGRVPPDAVDRMDEDTIQRPSALGVRIRWETEEVLLKALAVLSKNRYQSMAEFHTALLYSMPSPYAEEAAAEEKPSRSREKTTPLEKPVQPETLPTPFVPVSEPEEEPVQKSRTSGKQVRDTDPIIRNDIDPAAEPVRKIEKSTPQLQRKPEPVPDKTGKKSGIIVIAAILGVCILAGVLFGTGVLRRNNFTKVGSAVTFGEYEQDNNTSNGKEPIKWIVLDVKEGKSLIISKYILDCQQLGAEKAEVTWETCGLRYWLNNTFLNDAFSSEEQKRIPTVTVTAPKDSGSVKGLGNNTEDKVFFLSVPEAYMYFKDSLMCKATAYAKSQGCYSTGSGYGRWWLLSPVNSDSPCQVFISQDREGNSLVSYAGIDITFGNIGVRPVLWVNLDS